MKLLFLGDIVGRPGRNTVINNLGDLKKQYDPDIVIANGENAAAGHGLTLKIAVSLLKSGISVLTTGNHVWDQKSLKEDIVHEPRILRPYNYSKNTVGNGYIILPSKKGKIGVISLQGLTFMNPFLDNPFLLINDLIEKIKEETKIIFLDFHAETTSEKMAMAWYLDGKISAMIGTHTHVQTNDARVLPQGTAFMCDSGMCGPRDSVLGCDINGVIERFVTNMPGRFTVAECKDGKEAMISGAIIDINDENGKATSIEAINHYYKQ